MMKDDSYETVKEIGLGFLLAMMKVWDKRGFDPVAVYYASKKMEVIFHEILRGMCNPDKQGEFEAVIQDLDDKMIHEKEEFGLREQIEEAISKMKRRGSY